MDSDQILLVEDNPADVHLLRVAFHENKVACKLKVINDGQKAVEFLKELTASANPDWPSMLLLDLNLPRRSGLEVLQFVRNSPALMKLPVAVFTSSISKRDRTKAEEIGVDQFLIKPMDLYGFDPICAAIKGMLARVNP